ncbi:hypothetical protein PAPHI01_1356 [Pancytospora philotis]|nr:hypothetical protein PAPHI01_1356 [Pancytospora philotis]
MPQRDGERLFMTYIEYKAHCYSMFKEPLPRSIAGEVVRVGSLEYGLRSPAVDLRPVFNALAGKGGVVCRERLGAALRLLRIEPKNHFRLFELVGTAEIDYALFTKLFGA